MEIDKNIEILKKYFEMGYEINQIDSYYTQHDEFTRFVIVEKYPEREIYTKEGEYLIHTINLNIELTPPSVKYITLDITFDKDKINEF